MRPVPLPREIIAVPDHAHLPYDVLKLVARPCFDSTVALFYGAPDQKPGINSASGMLLRLGKPYLLTAKHVIDSYAERRESEPHLTLQIARGVIPDVIERVCGTEANADVVALDLSGLDVRSFAKHLSFHEPRAWPPDRAAEGTQTVLVGFPKPYRQILHEEGAVGFESLNVIGQVDSVAEDHFTCQMDLERLANRHPHGIWPDSYGALSGSPIFALRGEIQILELVGIVYEASDDLHLINAHHADLVSIKA